MISIKIERIILIVSIIVLINVFGAISTDIKVNYVAYNAGVSPDDLIKSKYQLIEEENLDYAFVDTGSHIFYIVENEPREIIGDAFKMNEKSGYAFEFPGITAGLGRNVKTEFFSTPYSSGILLIIHKYRFEYAVEIIDEKENKIEYYIDGVLLDNATIDSSSTIIWATSLSTNEEWFEIYAIQNNEKFHVIDTDEAKELLKKLF